jgi:hypothetical protein
VELDQSSGRVVGQNGTGRRVNGQDASIRIRPREVAQRGLSSRLELGLNGQCDVVGRAGWRVEPERLGKGLRWFLMRFELTVVFVLHAGRTLVRRVKAHYL